MGLISRVSSRTYRKIEIRTMSKSDWHQEAERIMFKNACATIKDQKPDFILSFYHMKSREFIDILEDLSEVSSCSDKFLERKIILMESIIEVYVKRLDEIREILCENDLKEKYDPDFVGKTILNAKFKKSQSIDTKQLDDKSKALVLGYNTNCMNKEGKNKKILDEMRYLTEKLEIF